MVVLFVIELAFNMCVGYAESSTVPKSTGYTIDWLTIDGDGVMFSTGASYEFSGTVGHFDAGTQSGGGYTLNSGHWVELFGYRLYLPLIMR